MIPAQSIESPKTVMEKVGPNIISHVSNTYKTDYPPIIKIDPIMGIDFSITKHVLMLWIVALIVSVASISRNRALNYINVGYTEIIRAIPVLVMILWVYYGLPVLLNLNFTAFTAGIIALSICESPFIAEIFRSGIQAVPKGQKEAGSSMGMNFFQIFYHITLPQAVRIILPALGNQFVYMLKMSSLVSIIGLNELTRKANELVVSQYRPLEIYTFLVLEYLVLILVVSFLVRRLEKRLKVY